MEKNIAEEAEVREIEIEKWRKKRLRLQKLDPHLDLTFRQVFLSKADVLDHQCYLIIKSKLMQRLSATEPQRLFDKTDFVSSLFEFEGSLNQITLETYLKSIDSFCDYIEKALDDKDKAKDP